MSKPVLIGDFLHRIKRPIDLDPASLYKLVTVKLKHKGVVLRGEKLGVDIKSKMYQVKEGDFILSGIDARNGAFGIVPKELDGAVVTNDFWCFEIDDEVVDKSFFLELTSTHWFDEICRKGSDGTTQRIRLQKGKFFNQTIYLPELSEQRKFNKWFQAIKVSNKTLSGELTHQQALLKKLSQQILQEAIEGKLTADWRAQNPEVEPASELLKRIAAEKAQLVKDKKIKAQNPLPPIVDEEKSIELPKTWQFATFESCSINKDEHRIPITKADRNTKDKIYDYYGASGVIDKIDGFIYEGRHLLVGEDGANLLARVTPIAFIAEGKFWVNNHAHVIATVDSITLDYLAIHINAINLKPYISGGFQPKLSQGNLNRILIALPPLEEQQAIVTKVEKLLGICNQLEVQITQNQIHSEQLMKAVLKEAFNHNSTETQKANTVVPFKSKGIDYYKRTLLAAEIVYQLQNEPTLGHLKLQKLIYLCQKSENMQLPLNFLQQAAGPYDPKMARSLDKQLYDKCWFQYQREEMLKYKPLQKAGEHKSDFQKYFSSTQAGIQAMIDLFRTAKSDQMEIVATLYACWENLIESQSLISNEILIQQFYAWSEEKIKYPEDRLLKAIAWMQAKKVIPVASYQESN
ncbi:MAG: restriction endonuclease subunit S [Methylophaga sp.]|uniref:restriction endonuclease subunit S n=1 Tax=Methylophaga sp. TaxID=2024840 RepID=UPI000C0F8F30|nr:restriction endonuclease subunit S [Methylophaga sp.]MBL1458462.1 restriction endonuclease subunit S [Methylophaga sp.]